MSKLMYSYECDAYRLNPSDDMDAPNAIHDPSDKSMPGYLRQALLSSDYTQPRQTYYLDERRLAQARRMYEDLRVLAGAWCGKAYLLLDHTNGKCWLGLDQVLSIDPIDAEESDIFTDLLIKSTSYSIDVTEGADRINVQLFLNGVLRPVLL